ncbi:Protein transport protein Sec16B [Camelus dromedarius]|uniref:Protein transport protein Sec16B n=1 Tax=Camelus dromedarius TaxID=9838 RepID=A0A5N4CN48_CAMDR|nr:Protein transport protein Sec16B [Camelus dromedarius]
MIRRSFPNHRGRRCPEHEVLPRVPPFQSTRMRRSPPTRKIKNLPPIPPGEESPETGRRRWSALLSPRPLPSLGGAGRGAPPRSWPRLARGPAPPVSPAPRGAGWPRMQTPPLQSSGFGWFSWFRSKPATHASPSGDEDSSDTPDSEQETPRASSPPQPSPGLSLTPPLEPQPLPGTCDFPRDAALHGYQPEPAKSPSSAPLSSPAVMRVTTHPRLVSLKHNFPVALLS